MKFKENPDRFDFSSVKGELDRLFRHFDEVDTVIRIMDYDESRGGFFMSMTPPPSEEEVEVITQKLQDEGYTYDVESGHMITVTGERDS